MKRSIQSLLILGIAFCYVAKSAYAQDPDPAKVKKAKAEFVNSFAHKQWTSIKAGGGKTLKPFAKPKNDPEALSKVKRIAVVSFEMNLRREEESRIKALGAAFEIADADAELEKVKKELEPFKPHLNNMYEALRQQFEKYGYTVITAEEVMNNAYYQSLEYKEEEEKAKGAWGGVWQIGVHAYDLKQITAEKLVKFPISNNKTIIEKVTGRLQKLQELARSLDVDAIILVESNPIIGFSWGKGKLIFGNKKLQNANGLKLDMIPANEPRIIWSAVLKKPTTWETTVKSTSALLIGRGFKGLENFGPDMKKFFETYGELAVINMCVNAEK